MNIRSCRGRHHTLLETRSLPSAWSTRQRPYCTRQRLCRVPHSAKSKRQSRIRRRVLCRVPFVGHSAKKIGRQPLTASLPSAGSGRHSAKLFPFFLKNPLPSAFLTRHSAKKKIFFFEKSFAECLAETALGKEKIFFFGKFFAECQSPGTRQSWETHGSVHSFAEC